MNQYLFRWLVISKIKLSVYVLKGVGWVSHSVIENLIISEGTPVCRFLLFKFPDILLRSKMMLTYANIQRKLFIFYSVD